MESDEVHAEVVALLDELRDRADGAQRDSDRYGWPALGTGRAHMQRHFSAWAPGKVLLLVGDDGLLRCEADELAAEALTNAPQSVGRREDAVLRLQRLRDLLHVMRR